MSPAPSANWDLVEVRGQYTRFDGIPVSGKVTFTPSSPRSIDIADLMTAIGTSISATLDETGSFSVSLAATDDPDVSSQGFSWTVFEDFDGGSTFSIAVPLAYKLIGIDLAEWITVPMVPVNQQDAFLQAIMDVVESGGGGGGGGPVTADDIVDATVVGKNVLRATDAAAARSAIGAAAVGSGVTTVAGRSGAVVLSAADVAGSFKLDALDLLPAQEDGLPVEVARYDANSISPQTDASAVASWPDDTGTTGALVQGTGANQPRLKLNQVNGLSAVRFAGGSYWMSKARALSTDFTIIIVGKPTNAIANPVAIGGYLTSYNGRICGPGAGPGSSATAAYPGFAVYRITVLAGIATVYRNGQAIDSRAAGNMTTLYVGQDGSGSLFSDWDIAHIRCYSGIVAPDEAHGIESLLARRYGLRIGAGSPSIRSRTTATLAGAQPATLCLPEGRVPGTPLPLVIFSHGGGGSEDSAFGYNGNPGASTDAIIAAGFAVASHNLHGDSAGNAQQLQDNLDLLAWVQSQITVSKILLIGQSLGGLPTLNAITKNTYGPSGIPVVGALLIYPVTDPIEFYGNPSPLLASTYGVVSGVFSSAAAIGAGTISLSVSFPAGTQLVLETGPQSELVTVASVSGAGPYSHVLTGNTTKSHALSATVSDAGTKINLTGYNPMYKPAAAFGNKRYRIYGSPTDVIVPFAYHSLGFQTKIAGTARESSLFVTRGNHGDQSNFNGRDQAQFLLRCMNDPSIV